MVKPMFLGSSAIGAASLFALVMLCAVVAPAQRIIDPFGYGSDADAKRLFFLNLQYTQSWVRSDTATYNSLLWADDFVHQSGSDGKLYPKKELAVLFGQPRFDDILYFYPEDVIIQFIAPDAAMVFARTPYREKKGDVEHLGRYNDVYVRRSGNWICVAANVVSQTAPRPEPTDKFIVPDFVNVESLIKGSPDDIKQLERLNASHAEGFLKSESDLVKDILANDYMLQDADGKLYSRAEAIQQIESGNAKKNISSYRIENVLIRFVAKDIAMIHAAAVSTLTSGKMVGTQYNDVYVKRNGKWVCVSGNNTAIRND